MSSPTSALRNGILLYETLWVLSAIISPASSLYGGFGLLWWVSTVVSMIVIPLLIWKSQHHGIMKYIVFLHGLLGTAGIISPLAAPISFWNYVRPNGKPALSPDSPSGMYEWAEVVFVAFWLRYLTSFRKMQDSVIYLTSLFLLVSSVPWDRVMSAMDVREYTESGTQTQEILATAVISTEPVIIDARVDSMKKDVSNPSIEPKISRKDVEMSPSCATEWEYIDLYGSIQGPFTRSQMSTWYKAGFLEDDLRVSPARQYTFKAIRDEFPNGTVPFD